MKEKVIVGLGRDEAERILMWGRRWCIQPFGYEEVSFCYFVLCRLDRGVV